MPQRKKSAVITARASGSLPAEAENPISHKGQNAKLNAPKQRRTEAGRAGKGLHFAGAIPNAKLVRAVANAVRHARLDYEGFRRLSAAVRKQLGLRRPPRSRKLPQL